ncbi:MAG TPA: MATE family efflux transporter [Candidatus Acidoferrum sp.]|nr:MATE family efflux transporter [Candidatus Acidoferrum sp.]
MSNTARPVVKPDLIHDPVATTLYRTAVPTTLGAIAVIAYYLANTFFVGLLGTGPLAAIGFTFPATILFTYFGVGLGIGTSALVGKAIGCKDSEHACEITFAGLAMGLLIGLALMAPALLSIDWMFPLLGAGEEHLPMIRSYMHIWYVGMPLQLMQFAGTAVIRATGNARLHGKMMTISAIINAVLDPLLIFGIGSWHGMGIAGAALATVTAWAFTIVVIVYQLGVKDDLLRFHLPPHDQLLESWRKLLVITAPAALANMITPMANAVLTATIAGYGTVAVAAYGVASRLENFILIVVLGMSMSVPPFISQNFGAHLYDRVRLGLRLSLRFVLYWQLSLYLLVAATAPWIAAIFTREQSVHDIIVMVLRILPASYAFQGMVVLSASSFNALHAPRNGLVTSLLRFFVFYVPLALLGNHIDGMRGLFIGAAIGNLLAAVVVTKWISVYTKRLLAAQPQPA